MTQSSSPVSLLVLSLFLALTLAACSDDGDKDADSGTSDPESSTERPPPLPQETVYEAANGCFVLQGEDADDRVAYLVETDGVAFAFTAETPEAATPFLFRAADLGTYLLYDTGRHFLTARDAAAVEDGSDADSGPPPDPEWVLGREAALQSAETLRIDRHRSTGEWDLALGEVDPSRLQLRNGSVDLYLSLDGLAAEAEGAARITLVPADGCVEFPELTVDAIGEVVPREWDDGDVFGIVDAHSHLLTNKGFGGGGMFHGAPYHRLGVEHALPDCDHTHGEDGRRDIIGFFFDGDQDLDVDSMLPIIASGRTPDFNHHTEGYPEFVEWPSSWQRATHQMQYYRWLERAWKGGLRLVVELATGNSVLCDFMVGIRAQGTLYDCSDMVGVDRAMEAAREMERYIDAQHGGPGEGWFRIVESPAEAREVIRSGRLAVVLGIETSNLFDCFLNPPPGFEPCTPEDVFTALDDYHARGVRVIFPVHKYDNAFSPGDGHRGIIELGNLINTGHYSNFVDDCPFDQHVFDSGDVLFGGLNEPREEYNMLAPLNMFGFRDNPIVALLPLLSRLQEPPIRGNYCQQHGLTALGRALIEGIIERGMIIDIAHIPQHAVIEALDMLEAADYPASSTHGDTYNGRLFDIGGHGRVSVGRCADPDQPDTLGNGIRNRVQLLRDRGLYPAAGFSFDMNGFAGGRQPRFGELSSCPQPQPNPITYPFASFDGDIEFTQPQLGNREVDFNTEGMIHIGLLPELIEELRRDGMSDEDIEPLFRSAEAYLRMWERAEERAAALR
ncbi:MAG: hypothetical protein EA398_10655 [Deltaproteobacteria bacterium]|nr:MAG: hypothetical protein EA398_10655 [Deltaproteobacteria bacterium]